MSTPLPAKWDWLSKEPGPKMIVAFINIYGVKETIGSGDNPVILGWAEELGIKDYIHDSIAWCGLEMAKIAHDAGKPVVDHPLWAANWLHFGIGVPISEAMLGDVLVFKRPGGNHVGLYVGEDDYYFYVAGGNQSDMSGFARIAKDRCIGARRPVYTNQPANVRKIFIGDNGMPVSANEA
jgi:uncharacterized protein (TIGR02594 family)